MNIETLHDLFLYELRGAYYVETELADALEGIRDRVAVDTLDEVADEELHETVAEAFASHREETERQVERLERAFDAIDRQPETREMPSLDALVDETERFNNVVLNDAIRPLFYLDAGTKIERLELRMYDSLLRLARALDAPEDAIDALETNRREEEAALTNLRELSDGSEADSVLDELAERSSGF